MHKVVEQLIRKFGEETTLKKVKEDLNVVLDLFIERYGEKTSLLKLKKELGKDARDITKK
jgi:hypothetical protein